MTEAKVKKVKPDIRAITRLVPPSGNLVQGQSELYLTGQLSLDQWVSTVKQQADAAIKSAGA